MVKGKWTLSPLACVVVTTLALSFTQPAVAQPLGPLPAMRQIRTEHYIVHTDLADDLSRELGQRLDAMFDEYARRLADFTQSREFPMLEVYLFQRKQDYARFTQNRFPNTGGVFISTGRQNLLAGFLEGQGRDALRRVLQHEAFHQFAHLAISPDLPIWLNEGLAQVFEEGLWTGKAFMLGQVPPRRLRQLQADIEGKRLIDFQQFLTMTSDQWADNLADDANRGATQYNQAWAMTHFLIHAHDGAFRKRLIDMLKQIKDGKPADAAFGAAFSNNYRGFRQRFDEWAATLTATPEATMIDRQGVLGDLLISLSEKNQRFADVDAFRKAVTRGGYQLQYTKGEVTWKTDTKIDTYFSNTAGNLLGPSELFFEPQDRAPLPDIVCVVNNRLRLRTRFYTLNGRTWHEFGIETR